MTSRIYLASKSPRRREILAGLGYEICLLTPEISPQRIPRPMKNAVRENQPAATC